MGSLFVIACLIGPAANDTAAVPTFTVQRSVARQGFDGNTCWVHARAGALPASRAGQPPLVVLTMQKLLLSGSDVFYALNEMRTSDLGETWTAPHEHDTLARRTLADGTELGICDFTPAWHLATGRLLGIGHSVHYQDNRVMHVRRRATAYSVRSDPRVAG